jgi:uncharacterized protein (TIGR03435 family)
MLPEEIRVQRGSDAEDRGACKPRTSRRRAPVGKKFVQEVLVDPIGTTPRLFAKLPAMTQASSWPYIERRARWTRRCWYASTRHAALARRGTTAPPNVDHNGPPLATALADQLGLKLEARRAPIQVVVIDRIEKLIED